MFPSTPLSLRRGAPPLGLLLLLVGLLLPTAARAGRIIATVELEVITSTDLEDAAALRRLQGARDDQFGDLLDELINRRLMLLEWPANVPLPDDAMQRVRARAHQWFESIERQFGGPDGLDDALAALEWPRGKFQAYLERRVAEDMKIQTLLRRRYELPTDEEIAAYEKELRDKGLPTRAYNVSQILFHYDEKLDGEQTRRLQAKAMALDALGRLEGGADFPALAKELSDHESSAAVGGSLGRFMEGQLPPIIEQTLDKLKPGEVSMPIIDDEGIRLLRLDKRQTAAEFLRQERVRESRDAYVAELRAKRQVEIVDPEIRAAYDKRTGKLTDTNDDDAVTDDN